VKLIRQKLRGSNTMGKGAMLKGSTLEGANRDVEKGTIRERRKKAQKGSTHIG